MIRESTIRSANLADLFPHFDSNKSLQEADICYENRNRPKGPLFVTDFVFESLKNLAVRNTVLSAKDVRVLVKCMPALSSLALEDFQFRHDKDKSSEGFFKDAKCDETFASLDSIASLPNLKSLTLEYYGNPHLPTWILKRFFKIERMPRLRRFACNCFEIEDCFEAFCQLAEQKPKQSFAFGLFAEHINFMNEIMSAFGKSQPRNVTFF